MAENKLQLIEDIESAKRFGIFNVKIDNDIINDINPKLELRKYQNEALENYLFYMKTDSIKKYPVHLMFNMATGSGKTLIMASCIIDLYKKGYRNFIFFVDSTSIIEKTKHNFINSSSEKYLFNSSIMINNKEVFIKESKNFEGANRDNINIVFTTIQGLHSTLNIVRENALSYEDFEDNKVALISDEAHHINSMTKKKLTKTEQEESQSWEWTINRVLKANKENIMLEFTATIDLENESIYQKYKDKIIYRYNLKQFRQDGYSKDVKILKSDMELKYRIIQALICSQFRRKIAEKNGIYLKPVIMIKSPKIETSKETEELFYKIIDELKEEDILLIKNLSEKTEILKQTFEYLEENKISLSDFTTEIKYEFDKKTRSININDDKELSNNQILINSLENRNNEIRVIFAVNKLDEGWDVLNLFDIVRVAENRGNTLSEAQLIGRGARYSPFKTNDEQEKYKRKFDNSKSDLRFIEQLHYHSINESKFISDLKTELEKSGIFIDEDKKQEINLKVKENIKTSDFYTNGKIFVNEKIKRDKKNINKLSDIFETKVFEFKLYGTTSNENLLFDNLDEKSEFIKDKKISLKSISISTIRSAINKNLFYKFDNLKKYIPNLKSINEFITSENYLSSVDVKVFGEKDKLSNLSKDELLKICIKILNDIEIEIKNNLFDYEGTKEFKAKSINKILVDKTLNIIRDSETAKAIDINLSNENWYVYSEAYGTSEEKALIKFVYNFIGELQEKYEDVKLIRNEKLFQIYNFKNGNAFEPDFVLFLKEKNEKNYLYYQLFIEPKGEHLFEVDKWKEDFLAEINQSNEIENLFENDNYVIYGLPFFNKDNYNKNLEFEEDFKRITKLELEIKNKTQVHFSERDNEVIEMIKDNLDDEKIIKYTKISKERLEELRKISH